MSESNWLFELTNALQPVRRAWIQASAAATADSGIPFPVATAVVLLARLGDGAQQSTLAELAGVNPAAMLRTLDQAEALGLCERREISNNRRIKPLHLLPAGKVLATRVEHQLAELREEMFAGIEPDEIESAVRTLRAFEERILSHLSKS
ncbi:MULTISPECIES: MarR family winged helix-turn-helix transcriptional regulator [Pseudomonas]|uniref:MarR family winged helix-turn-helix transcriptional regulator n=1 Tax=Pseudomonas TaxID=286 RepID=UPI0012971199|nr:MULTISPECIES: MarR family transcriptional regulator [Pseudomonas]